MAAGKSGAAGTAGGSTTNCACSTLAVALHAPTHSLRVFDPASKRRPVYSLDVPRVRLTSSSGSYERVELRLQSLPGGLASNGKPRLRRRCFFDIGPDRFRVRQDRSDDNGGSWEDGEVNTVAQGISSKAAR